jgi:hypothetical protein
MRIFGIPIIGRRLRWWVILGRGGVGGGHAKGDIQLFAWDLWVFLSCLLC